MAAALVIACGDGAAGMAAGGGGGGGGGDTTATFAQLDTLVGNALVRLDYVDEYYYLADDPTDLGGAGVADYWVYEGDRDTLAEQVRNALVRLYAYKYYDCDCPTSYYGECLAGLLSDSEWSMLTSTTGLNLDSLSTIARGAYGFADIGNIRPNPVQLGEVYSALTDAYDALVSGDVPDFIYVDGTFVLNTRTGTRGTVTLATTTGYVEFTVPTGTVVTEDTAADVYATASITGTTLTITGVAHGERYVVLTLADHADFVITVNVPD